MRFHGNCQLVGEIDGGAEFRKDRRVVGQAGCCDGCCDCAECLCQILKGHYRQATWSIVIGVRFAGGKIPSTSILNQTTPDVVPTAGTCEIKKGPQDWILSRSHDEARETTGVPTVTISQLPPNFSG